MPFVIPKNFNIDRPPFTFFVHISRSFDECQMPIFLDVQDSSIGDLVTHSLTNRLTNWILISDNDYNNYNDYDEYNDYNDYNDANDYSDYNDYRDSDLDLDWERFSELVT